MTGFHCTGGASCYSVKLGEDKDLVGGLKATYRARARTTLGVAKYHTWTAKEIMSE